MSKSYADEDIIILIDNNRERTGDTKCIHRLRCLDITCTRCPMFGGNGGADLAAVRLMDPRGKPGEGEDEAEAYGFTGEPLEVEGTYTGGSSDYYQVTITCPTTEGRPEYIAECNDIIEALGMNFAEGNAFKALWRRAAQRTLGLRKAGAKDDGLYDAEKVEFFGARLVAQSKGLRDETE